MDTLLVILAILVGVAGGYYVYMQQQAQAAEAARVAASEAARREQEKLQQKKPKPKKVDITAELKKKKKQQQATGDAAMGGDAIDESHPWLLHVLKGHKYAITAAAFSPNGRFIATSSTDRTVRVYLREALTDTKSRPHQIKLEYDHATALTFSSDGRTLVIATVNGLIKLYQKLKLKPELVGEFTADHKTNVHSVLMNDIGSWATIVTCAGDADTDVKFWGLDGKLLQVVNTNQVRNYHCVASKDNRYIAVAAYTPEVKILEITREKNGAFKHANKIMSLQGHRTGVIDLAFNGSETIPVDRIVTTCKDSSIRLWDINVRYAQQEDPKVIKAFTPNVEEQLNSLDMAPHGKLVVASRDQSVLFLSPVTGKEYAAIDSAFEEPIKRVLLSPQGDEVLVLGKNAKHIKIYKTPSP